MCNEISLSSMSCQSRSQVLCNPSSSFCTEICLQVMIIRFIKIEQTSLVTHPQHKIGKYLEKGYTDIFLKGCCVLGPQTWIPPLLINAPAATGICAKRSWQISVAVGRMSGSMSNIRCNNPPTSFKYGSLSPCGSWNPSKSDLTLLFRI